MIYIKLTDYSGIKFYLVFSSIIAIEPDKNMTAIHTNDGSKWFVMESIADIISKTKVAIYEI